MYIYIYMYIYTHTYTYSLFDTPYFQTEMPTDVVGVEICGAVQNAIAIALGTAEGLDLGASQRQNEGAGKVDIRPNRGDWRGASSKNDREFAGLLVQLFPSRDSNSKSPPAAMYARRFLPLVLMWGRAQGSEGRGGGDA